MTLPPDDQAPISTTHSRSRFLARAGAAVGGAGFLGLVGADSAAAAAPPPEYEVRSFGALGDGLTDDTGAIQAAIDAARGAGGVVVFHGGTFSISGALKIYSRVILRGAGVGATVLKKKAGRSFSAIKSDGFDALTGSSSDGGIHSWAVESLSIDGSRGQGADGAGLQVYGHGYSLHDLAIFDCGGYGIWGEWNAEGVPEGRLEAFLSNVAVHDCSAGGIRWHGPHDSKWVNVSVFRCSPAGVASGSTTVGVDIKSQASGFRAVNCHVWGHHKYAWVLGCQGAGLISCFGEGAEVAQVVINGNMCDIVGGEYFGVWSRNDSVAFQIGTPERASAASFVSTLVHNCNRGALHFVNDHGIGRYELFVWQTVGEVVVVSPPLTEPWSSNRLDIVYSGGATGGALGSLKPFHFPGDVSTRGSLFVRGDVNAGGPSSRLGFFGAEPQPRGAPWSVAVGAAKRVLPDDASLADVRAVLGTLIGELQGYGLLAGQRAGEAPPPERSPSHVPPPAPPPPPAPEPPPPAAIATTQGCSDSRQTRSALVRAVRRIHRARRPPKAR